ncbi:monosaccharide ABC transporter ATP-binding protein, CUT2 family [Psychromonas ingrahamii 37]|uniref:Monosaccharide ABC transporter ATP-binding protein, CUT2 family n=1 Tax=Psychromonas ingrahamii (strain DSM 17664 / CCUG 51855 / 37) TaxID=357804 RepID=A1SYC9_PSYIN|nr:sugar ABC transporter ATP-binding protein [Psychromonas ingrahamii]ABM04494.1 monosaccharide ABC transporter ATP-binding protein, CUT2 family [Psychromonas ingrahamii 37]
MSNPNLILSISNITKKFPPSVVALSDVSLDIYTGEVHAIVGENGAGKSTLMKVIAGVHKPTSGTINYEGNDVVLSNPIIAKKMGILLIHQELSLVEEMTVAENIFIGEYPTKMQGLVDYKLLYKRTDEIITKLKCNFSSKDKVSHLSIAQKQMVEISRALVMKPKVIIFDEPTASLTDTEKFVLMDLINTLKKEGVAIVYISHRMDEIFTLSDRISVLRDGEHRKTVKTQATDIDEVIKLMIGRELNLDHIERNNKYDKTVIELKNLTQKNVFKDISFSVKQGEILGMYGLIGAGRTEVAEAIFGIRKIDSGEIYINDQLADINSSEKAVKNGIALVPEDRKEQGLVLEMSCKENLTLSILQTIGNFGFLNSDLEKKLMLEYKDLLSIKMADINDKISTLSGGNQQKIIIGKWLVTNPKLLILDEPTRGIDIGSKAEIHNLIRKLANEGYAILVISSEMPEVISLSDRVLVLRDGQISGEFSGKDITEEDLALTI